MEAMQYGLPLVVSNVGAPSEVVRNARLGFQRGSVDDLVQKLETGSRDKELRRRLASNCPKVLQEYNQDKVLDRILELYRRVVSDQ